MAKVALKNVSKTYAGGVAGVSAVDFEIGDREFAVIAGPPGSGKSTIIRLLAGVEEASSGEIFIGDRRINGIAPQDRDVAAVFGSHPLYPGLSVRENLALGLKLRKFGASEIKRRIDDAATVLGISDVLDGRAKLLNGLQRHRASLSRAVVRQPKVLLFDDPLARLERDERDDLRAEITKLHQRLGTTFIYATADPEEAMALGERLVVIGNGTVQQVAPAATAYDAPANLFVASFLGRSRINLIHGRLKAARDGLSFTEGEGGTIDILLPIGERHPGRDFVDQPIILGTRPEDIRVAPLVRGHERPAAFPALVDTVERLGATAIVRVDTGAHVIACRTEALPDGVAAGKRVRCEIDSAKAHLFDPASTQRLAEP